LYGEYRATPSEENLNSLLFEVELFARRVTLGAGGKYAQYLNHSTTGAYAQTDLSQNVTIKVWRSLDKFNGKSKFSVWVYRIAKNTVLDAVRQIQRRGEVELLEWKGYGGEYAGFRGASGKSADAGFNIRGGSKLPLGRFCAPDERKVRLSWMIANLPEKDQHIIYLVQEGYKPSEIGEEFGKNAKWASNQLTRIKNLLKKRADLAKRQKPSVIVMKKAPTPLPACEAA
jgi:RNA polymerase sigma factor (sigma-70 family)